MKYLIDVWFKPWLELSAADQVVMALECLTALIALAVIKVYVIDWFRGVKYYKGD